MDAIAEVAGMLGIASPRRGLSPLGMVAMIEKGLPVGALERVSRSVAPADSSFKYQIVARATLARRNRQAGKRLSAEESGRLARLAAIWAMANDVWGGADEARSFLFRQHPLLEGRRPIEVVLGTELGARLVENILGGLKYGLAA